MLNQFNYLQFSFIQEFTGNNRDRNEPVGNTIDPPIIARHVQIRVKSFKARPAMRVEFYGCTEGKKFPALSLMYNHFLRNMLEYITCKLINQLIIRQ